MWLLWEFYWAVRESRSLQMLVLGIVLATLAVAEAAVVGAGWLHLEKLFAGVTVVVIASAAAASLYAADAAYRREEERRMEAGQRL
ncbi:MAG: hypothetical protein A2172_04850 [Candidatus Woykebacteria bacterium RBG_13_40_15]|uniref:Uncharacterized protein n=1 Tax=Candidatus Woykebacteria bacterium RBG_13_40_15 TaxID=1802593 RepID=A0A1G1W772_9BACT|nr:MAG: hypothetical protein A2172_04850 [Candidatus Woykebacteria bacterium RBG_13_40_15]